MRANKGSGCLGGCLIAAAVGVVLLAVPIVVQGVLNARYDLERKEFSRLRAIAGRGDVEAMKKELANGVRADTVSPFEHHLVDLVVLGKFVPNRQLSVTLLHEAAVNGQPEMVRLLLENGAEVQAFTSPHLGTPLEWAFHGDLGGGLTVILKEYGVSKQEVLERYREVIRILIEKGALQPNASWITGPGVVLGEAAGLGDKLIMEMILAAGVTGEQKSAALSGVAGSGNEELFELLKPEDIPIEGLDVGLHAAAWGGNVRIAERLLVLGADVNNNVSDGKETPLHSAARSGKYAMIGFLIKRGAKPDVRDAKGALPVDLAKDDLTRAALQNRKAS